MNDRRRFYAEEVCAVAGVEDPVLRDAFATVERERFLGPGPWSIAQTDKAPGAPTYRVTADADPAHLYHNVVVAIDSARRLNNGHPSALFRWIAALELRSGQHAVHVGAGVGYYSAILAEVVGPTGRVTAIELDPDLAERARANLADRPWVDVFAGDGSRVPSPVDAVFVNAGCTHPRSEWLDALADGGRLLVPLTAHSPQSPPGTGSGLYVRATRRGVARRGANRRGEARRGETWSAEAISRVGIFDCAGARDESEGDAILALLRSGRPEAIRVLRRDPHEAGPGCLVHADRYCLQSEKP